jgi:hypothetical protein
MIQIIISFRYSLLIGKIYALFYTIVYGFVFYVSIQQKIKLNDLERKKP